MLYMNNSSVLNRIKQINIENKIWIIYIGIILLSWYSNYLEKDYYLNKNIESKNSYRKILILIFTVLVIVYYYFLNSSLEDVKNLKISDSDNKKLLVYLSFIASLLIFISGIIFLFIALSDDDLNVELAFN